MQSKVTQEDFVRLPYNRDAADGSIRPSQSYWRSVLRRLVKNRVAMVSAAVILLIVVMSVVGPMMVPYGYEQTSLMESNLKPCAAHWFGTDKPGRDLWARVWVGARISLMIGLLGAIVPALVGVIIGGVSGYFGGWVDMLLTRFMDVCSCIPSLIYITLIMLLVDTAFGLDAASLSVAGSWMAACAYLMQVYYDFSGYSDMAIGLGRMFGFHFLENFNFPFISKSVSEFWRRWHISMCTWFRDYLYFPLGGSRVKSVWRLLFNMLMVWGLTGLWHGAAWTYILWGLGFFVMLAFERLSGLAMFMVVTITVMIRSDDLGVAKTFYSTMFGLSGAPLWSATAGVFLREYGWFLLAGVICGLPVAQWLREKVRVPENALRIVGAVLLAGLMVIALSYVAVVDYNPFIYFNF